MDRLNVHDATRFLKKTNKKKREAWFSIVCLTPPVLDKYPCVLSGYLTVQNVLLISFSLCVSTSTGKMISVIKAKWSSIPFLVNIFLTQFPISAKHEWLISIYRTAEGEGTLKIKHLNTTSAPPLTTCVTSGELLYITESWFSPW